MELQAYFVVLRNVLQCPPTVVPLQFVAHPEEQIDLELPLECVEQGGLATAVRPQEDNELCVWRQVMNREIDKSFEVLNSR